MALTYEQIMQKPGKRLSLQITYTQNGTTTTINHDNIFNAKPYYNSQLVGTIMHGFECETTTELPKDTGITLSVTARYNSDTQTRTYGPYYVKESKYNADKRDYTNECYDSFLNTMVEYQPLEDDETLNIEYPISIYDFFTKLVTKCGFTTNITKLPNGSNMMERDIYTGINYTYRNVFDDIAGATASCFYLDGTEVKIAELGGNKSITGKNLYGGFTFTKTNNDVTFTYNINGSISVNGTANANAFSMLTSESTPYQIGLEPGTYTLSGGNSSYFIQVLNSSGGLVAETNTSVFSKTFTIENETQVFIRIYMPSGTSYNGITYPMLEKGSSASTYEPYTNTNITIKDGTDTNIVGCNIEGNSYQYTTSGKNLFETTANSQTINGVEFTINSDGSIKAYGKATAQIILALRTNITLNAGTYTWSGCPVGGSDTTYDLRLTTASGYQADYGSGRTYTIASTTTLSGARIVIRNGITIDATFKPQLEVGSTATPYEQYTGKKPSPSPDYPQEVEVVEGQNILNNTATTKEVNGITFTINADKSVTINGSLTSGSNYGLKLDTISFKAGQTYTMSGVNGYTPTTLQLWTSSNSAFPIGHRLNSTNGPVTQTALADETCNIQLYVYSGVTYNNVVVYPMIIEGNEILPYVPYNNIGVNVVGKNLFNISSAISGIFYDTTDGHTISSSVWSQGEYIKVKSGTTISVSSGYKEINNSYELSQFNANKEWITGVQFSLGTAKTYTLESNTTYIKLGYRNDRANVNIQVETGSTSTTYEPYTSITTPINLQGNFIGKIGSIKDELNIDDLGNVILTKRIGKVNLSTLTYNSYNLSDGYKFYYTQEVSNIKYVSSNTQLGNGIAEKYILHIGSGMIANTARNCLAIDVSQISMNTIESPSGLLYYELATPYQVNLGKANIILNEGVNYITFLTGLDTRNTIEYRSSTPQITIDDDILMNKNIEFVGKVGPINSIIITRAEESDSIYKRDETATTWYEYKIADNQLMNNNDRDTFIDDIYHKLYGITYDIYDCELTGYGGFEPFTKIRIDTGDNQYNSYVFNNELIFNQGFRENIFAEETEQTQSDYQVMDTTDKRVNEAYLILNKQNRTLTAQVERMDIIATHIDETNGNVTEVTTTTGFTFNADGLNIYTNDNTYNTQINNVGTYYKDGTTILSQTTKDGTKTKDLDIFGYNRYCEDDINDDPQFIAVKYQNANNEEGYGHFYNGV